MARAGLEPARLAAQASKTCVAASYTTEPAVPGHFKPADRLVNSRSGFGPISVPAPPAPAVTLTASAATVASGGAGCARHMLEVLRSTSASAVAAASIFHFTEITPSEIKRELLENGLPIRVGL